MSIRTLFKILVIVFIISIALPYAVLASSEQDIKQKKTLVQRCRQLGVLLTEATSRYFKKPMPTRAELEQIIAASEGSLLHKNGQYAYIMGDKAYALIVEPQGFEQSFHALAEERLAVAFINGELGVSNSLQTLLKDRLEGTGQGERLTDLRPTTLYGTHFKAILDNIFSNPKYKDRIARNGTTALYEETFPIKHGETSWTYRIWKLSDTYIVIGHAVNVEVPGIMQHLASLWNGALQAGTNREKLRYVAEFEWWFIAADIPGRGAASIGDALSLVLQARAGLALRKQFQQIDIEVLSRSLPDYVEWRLKKGR
jgi:hypothetical protein